MRKALIITLVIVVLLTGIPILIGGMSMASCHDCGPASAGACTLAVLAGFSLFIVMLVDILRPRRLVCRLQLVYAGFDRPPRLV